MRYAETPPPPSLAGLVRCFWILEDAAAASAGPVERVLPDGCMELILQFGDDFLRHRADGSTQRQPRAVVAGQLETALRLQSTGRVGTFGVRFEPAGAALFLGPDADELTGSIVALDDLAPPGADTLAEELADAPDDDARVALATRWLLQRFDARRDRLDALRGVLSAVSLIEASGGRLDVGALAEHLGWNRRRLERAFRAQVGVSAKTLSRVVRFQHVVRALGEVPDTRLAALALDAGYSDQAHLARDFKALAGVSASAWLAEQHPLSDCFANGTSQGANAGAARDAPQA